MRITASAPAKLVLFGEYAVLEGAPAIVLAVDRRVHVVVEPRSASPWTVRTDVDGGHEGTLSLPADAEGPSALVVRVASDVLAAAGLAPQTLPPLSIEVSSAALHEGDAKLGLGSSAAVVVALGAALRRALVQLELVDAEPDAEARFRRDLETHRRAQAGLGSGVDVAASFHGGVLAYTPGSGEGKPVIEPLSMPPDLGLLCVWTGSSASTRAFLESVQQLALRDPRSHEDVMRTMSTLAERARDAFRAGRGEDIVELAARYRDAMQELGSRAGVEIVSRPHRELAALAASAGAAYKPSGAGGGDVGIAFSSSTAILDDLRGTLEGRGFRTVDLAPDPAGVRVGLG